MCIFMMQRVSGGEKLYTCQRCSETKTEVIPELEHEHRYDAVATAPTCTEQGYTTHTCRCGDSYVTDYTNPLGHSFTNYVSDGNATCTQDGTKTAVCDRCDATDTKPDVDSAHGHDFSEWTVVEEATQTADGLESRPCYHCGLEETRVLPRLENPFIDVPEGSFYHASVLWAVANGITNVISATTFGTDDQCMRAHVVTFLWRAKGQPESTGACYEAPIRWAVENGITNGMSATSFGINAICNRAQIVTFLYRAYN